MDDTPGRAPDPATGSDAVLAGTARRLLARAAHAQAGARLPSLVAGIVRDGAIVWQGGRGRLDGRAGGDRPHGDVQYRIGSITKTVTAIAVLRLHDEGALALDDPLERHLAGTPFGRATIGQLLAHRGGVQAETAGPWWERTPGGPWPDVVGALAGDAQRHPPGQRFHYSNLGFGALGEVVARRRGRPWFEVVRDEILLPLGMARTTYHPVAPWAAALAVHPFADVVHAEPTADTGALAPAGQLWSTLHDLGRLAAFLLGGDGAVLHADTLAEMKEPARTRTGEDRPAYGLGLQLHGGADGARRYGHGGSMPGGVGAVTVDDGARVASVWLANTTYGGDWELGGDLLDVLIAEEPPVASEWVATEPPAGVPLDALGTWCWGPNVSTLRAGAGGRLELVPQGARRGTRFRRVGDEWVGLDEYFAGERLRFAPDGRSFDLATFVFTRSPYGDGPIPGGVDPQGWHA